MKCPHETHVVYAATQNTWTSALRAHVASCEACAAAAGVAPFMERLAGSDVGQRALPDPAHLWLSAQLPAPAAAGKVGRPVRVVQVVGYLMVATTWVGLLAAKWSALESWVSSFVPVSGGGSPFPALALLFMVLPLSALAVTLALHAVLGDEG